MCVVMASSSLNSEGRKKINVMSLDYLKNHIIRKTSSKSTCICSKDVGLNLDDEVGNATTDLECVTVNGERKDDICNLCGKTMRKHKPGFFKFLRKQLWWKNNLSADSLSNKSSCNKLVSDPNDCAFSPVHSDFMSKDNLNYNGCAGKHPCNSISDVIGSSKSSLNNKVGDEISSVGSTGKNYIRSIDLKQNSSSNYVAVVEKKDSGLEETPSGNCGLKEGEINLNCNVNNKEIESQASQSSEIVQFPSPKTRSLTFELLKLSKFGWYWGPISREEAEEKLQDQPDGAFLVRDSSADHYLLTLSFRSSGKLLHTRIEHSQGLFSFYHQPEQEGFATIGELIDHSVSFSQSAVYCYSRPKSPGHPAFPVRLTNPVSRFTQVRSLQYLCRFIIRQYIRVDNIENLPLPNTIKGYLLEGHY